jgi:6-pyruvoyltetrahydropterin/6-carboxytetrahydropterin synthase
MIRCARRFEFDAGHRVVGHLNKCQYIHGHRYVLEVIAESEQLDELGMVVDFGLLKKVIKSWIDKNFDHTLILKESDKNLGDEISKSTGQKIYYLKQNPTAENIAIHLKLDVIPKLFNDGSFQIVKIKLFETPNCYVEV